MAMTWQMEKQLKDLHLECCTIAIDITALQEMRCIGQDIIQARQYSLCYSCNINKHQFGVGYLVNEKVKHLVIGFTPGHYICYLCI